MVVFDSIARLIIELVYCYINKLLCGMEPCKHSCSSLGPNQHDLYIACMSHSSRTQNSTLEWLLLQHTELAVLQSSEV